VELALNHRQRFFCSERGTNEINIIIGGIIINFHPTSVMKDASVVASGHDADMELWS
jgi:hypothetical protein